MPTKWVCEFHVYYNLGSDSSLNGRHIIVVQFNSPSVYIVIIRAPTHIRGKSLKNINCSSKTCGGQKETYLNFDTIMNKSNICAFHLGT